MIESEFCAEDLCCARENLLVYELKSSIFLGNSYNMIHTLTSTLDPIATSNRHSELACSSCIFVCETAVGAAAAYAQLMNDHSSL